MTRRTRGLVVLSFAITTGGLASAAVHRNIQQRDATEPRPDTFPVVVAARALPMGTRLAPEDVKTIAWPTEATLDGAFAKVEDVVGHGLVAAVSANEPLTSHKVAPSGTGAGLPPAIPPGMRAISVKVDEVVGVAGFAVPGSHVDVLVALRAAQDSVSRIVASNVEVLAVGTRTDVEQARDYKSGSTVVTLLVTPTDAERISLASHQGSITLTLRNPLDTTTSVSSGTRLMSLVGPVTQVAEPHPVSRRRATGTPPSQLPTPRVHIVETIRAGKRTEEAIR